MIFLILDHILCLKLEVMIKNEAKNEIEAQIEEDRLQEIISFLEEKIQHYDFLNCLETGAKFR